MSEVTTKPVYAYDRKVAAIHKLRVNVKSLAAEAKIIRQECRRCGILYEYELTRHRTGRLREEARVAQLAIAFARGRTYRSAEKHTKDPPINLANAVGIKLAKAGIITACLSIPESNQVSYSEIKKWLSGE